jgi:hypothetical protein
VTIAMLQFPVHKTPSDIGWLKNKTHSLSSGLFLVAMMISVAGMAVVILISAKRVNR